MPPALYVHQSNRLEYLADSLADALAAERGDPLAVRHVLCQSPPLGRWLRHRVCRRHGVSLLLETGLPAGWLWRTAAAALGLPQGEDPLAREPMQWRLHALLDPNAPLMGDPACRSLARYLEDDRTGLKRWQLAGRIADVFDRYQYHRPELIRAWSRGAEDGGWQGRLWRALADEAPWHRVALLDRFVAALRREGLRPAWPPRLDLFSTHNLPPLLLEAFAALSTQVAMHLWLLVPTPEYWADLTSARDQARRRLERPEETGYWQAGHPLLTQWGRQGQVFQDLLLELDAGIVEGLEHFEPPAGDTLLARVQAAICRATEARAGPESAREDEAGAGPSIQVHVCHGPLRECQVLHDRLLHCLAADPTLEPEDILVLVPEISRYAPYIEAVFGREPRAGERRLPFNLSDVVLADEHPLIRAFLQLLELPESRFTRAEVLALLDVPEVRRRFGIEDEAAGELAEHFDRLRVYWGLDGRDKAARLDLPAIDENTWNQAFQRLLAGFALGEDALYRDIAPQPGVTAATGDQAARFFELLGVLRQAALELARPRPPGHWARTLGNLVDALFGERPDEEGRLDRIREALGELDRIGETTEAPLSPTVLRHWLEGRLATRDERGRFYSGGVTFCAMQPLRGVPFRVICVLGLQEAAFPRRRRPAEFDHMAERWRHGDPDPGLEDRYLFLETLLAARERLILSYTGRDLRSNQPLQPSVILQELLDHLDQRYRLDGQPPTERIVRVHALQPFGRANYTGTPPRAFDPRWLAVARALVNHRPPAPNPEWPKLAVEAPVLDERAVSPAALARFLRDPARRFVQQQLRLFQPGETAVAEDEPFELAGLEDWALRQRLLEALLTAEAGADTERALRAEGLLPHGAPGRRVLETARAEVESILARAQLDPPLRPAPVDVALDLTVDGESWRLSGRLTAHYSGVGLLHVAAGKLRIADLLPLWVAHLCLAAAGTPATAARWIANDRLVALAPVAPESAREYLARLVAVYREGQQRPLPFFRRTASDWAAKLQKSPDDRAAALNAARRTWTGSMKSPGEREGFYIQTLLRGRDWVPDEDFERLAERILGPLLAHLEVS